MVQRRRNRSSAISKSLIAGAVVIAVSGLTYGIALYAGWLSPAAPLAQKPSREGRVPVPRSLVSLKAYEKVQREDVFNLSDGDDSYYWLPKAQVEAHPEWFTRVDDIVGRVMARDKRADFVFSEKDFLPEGSRSGLAGGVPVGKQGFFLDAETVPGVRFLKSGDRFDLLASLPEESQSASSEYGLLMGGIKARGGKPIPLSGVRILAQNAEMIALTTSRDMTTQGGLNLSATDSRGRSTTNTREERVAIAIDPTEAVPLTQALGDKLDIYMVARSGQETAATPDNNLLHGRIAAPATATTVKAFETLRASDLAESSTGELQQYYFKPEDIRDDWILQPERLIGRVLSRDVEPGYIFSESDFLPPGSLIQDKQVYEPLRPEDLVDGIRSAWIGRVVARELAAGTPLREEDLFPVGAQPGFSAAIPVGRMAISIETSKAQGAAELSRGDHCDLLASNSFDTKTLGGVELSPALTSELLSRVTNRVLASDAIVIQHHDDQIVLAITAAQIAALTKAIATKTPIFCIARGQMAGETLVPPETSAEDSQVASDPNPLSGISISETLIGGKRAARAYRRTQ